MIKLTHVQLIRRCLRDWRVDGRTAERERKGYDRRSWRVGAAAKQHMASTTEDPLMCEASSAAAVRSSDENDSQGGLPRSASLLCSVTICTHVCAFDFIETDYCGGIQWYFVKNSLSKKVEFPKNLKLLLTSFCPSRSGSLANLLLFWNYFLAVVFWLWCRVHSE